MCDSSIRFIGTYPMAWNGLPPGYEAPSLFPAARQTVPETADGDNDHCDYDPTNCDGLIEEQPPLNLDTDGDSIPKECECFSELEAIPGIVVDAAHNCC